METSYAVLGAMAGSSMDGLDLVLVEFTSTESWKYMIQSCDTIPYEKDLYVRLEKADVEPKEEQKKMDIFFGQWIAEAINRFLNGRSPDLLAIHGHTIRHAPEQNVSWQLGDGGQIATITGIRTITEFRSLDILNGGQGAPLVPFGDFELFRNYDACLNLGGIANVSILADKTAWDVCPCNQVLNYYASKLGTSYDNEGTLARSGSIDYSFFSKLEELSYFNQKPPKSLPNSFIDTSLLELVDPHVGLRSYTEFIAKQIAKDLIAAKPGKLLITGGGTFNTFLVECIKKNVLKWEVILPSKDLINYKEALIFAFLGLKKLRGEVNVLSSVTGASMDSSSGIIHLPE